MADREIQYQNDPVVTEHRRMEINRMKMGSNLSTVWEILLVLSRRSRALMLHKDEI